tara:strand:+ start:576 stop:737 length:162 start_codon:yes stop_codon:yes gene_type:complete
MMPSGRASIVIPAPYPIFLKMDVNMIHAPVKYSGRVALIKTTSKFHRTVTCLI